MLSEMKKRYGNIRIPQKFVLVVKDDHGNEKVLDDDDTDLEAGTILYFIRINSELFVKKHYY